MMLVKWRVLVVVVAAVAVTALGLIGMRIWQFRDRYVMVTVEESSTSAVTAWPLMSERLPGSFVDASSKSVSVDAKPSLLGVSLCLHYSASSQGIEIADSMRFARTGRAFLNLTGPISYLSDNLDGGRIELVDNTARVLSGGLVLESTRADGSVRFRFGDRRITLRPGESWAELLAMTPDGPVTVDAANWESDFYSYLEKGYPTTRLAVANRGFWPKSGVTAEVEP